MHDQDYIYIYIVSQKIYRSSITKLGENHRFYTHFNPKISNLNLV